jgi:hypothetical protein
MGIHIFDRIFTVMEIHIFDRIFIVMEIHIFNRIFTVMEIHIFAGSLCPPPNFVASDKRLYPCCEGQTHSPKLKALFCALLPACCHGYLTAINLINRVFNSIKPYGPDGYKPQLCDITLTPYVVSLMKAETCRLINQL